MFLEAFVCSQGGRADPPSPEGRSPWKAEPLEGRPPGRQTPLPECTPPEGTPPRRQTSPPLLTSSGGHCSGRYASHWNFTFFATSIPVVFT